MFAARVVYATGRWRRQIDQPTAKGANAPRAARLVKIERQRTGTVLPQLAALLSTARGRDQCNSAGKALREHRDHAATDVAGTHDQ